MNLISLSNFKLNFSLNVPKIILLLSFTQYAIYYYNKIYTLEQFQFILFIIIKYIHSNNFNLHINTDNYLKIIFFLLSVMTTLIIYITCIIITMVIRDSRENISQIIGCMIV